MAQAGVHYEFGAFVLDVDQQRLLHRDTGKAVDLVGKVFDTLLHFVEHAGETLPKEVLLRAIWPDVIVEENSLTQNVSTLRGLLGEVRGEHRYIATIARKGYRFAAPVTRHEGPPVPSDLLESRDADQAAPPRRALRWKTWALPGLAVLLLVAALAGVVAQRASPDAGSVTRQKLAILPFKPLASAPRDESLELGMTESLIAGVGQEGSPWNVSPLSSVRRFTALEQDAIAAGRELGVDAVLEGTLQRSGDRLRVSARLLRVADSRQLWAQSFDQDFTTIFEVQDVIATRVARALSAGWVRTGLRERSSTRDPEAYALYASGRLAWSRQTQASLLQAIGFFEQAIARDPQYALAWSGLADSYAVLGVFGIRAPRDVFPQARRAADRALSIDPDLAAAHSALGHILVQYEHDWEGASREYAEAIRLDASVALTHHRLGLLHAMQGDTAGALAASDIAQQLEPLWIAPRVSVGSTLYYAKRYDESIRMLEQILVTDESAANARSMLIRNLIAKGDFQRALSELDRGPLQAPGSHSLRAQALALSGHKQEARAELERVLELSRQQYVAAYDIALIYAALSDSGNFFQWLERAVMDRSTLLVFAGQDPMLDAFRDDARFRSVVQRIGNIGG